MSFNRTSFILLSLLLALFMASSTGAQNIHVRYFESADVLLVDQSFQILSLATLEDENITYPGAGGGERRLNARHGF